MLPISACPLISLRFLSRRPAQGSGQLTFQDSVPPSRVSRCCLSCKESVGCMFNDLTRHGLMTANEMRSRRGICRLVSGRRCDCCGPIQLRAQSDIPPGRGLHYIVMRRPSARNISVMIGARNRRGIQQCGIFPREDGHSVDVPAMKMASTRFSAAGKSSRRSFGVTLRTEGPAAFPASRYKKATPSSHPHFMRLCGTPNVVWLDDSHPFISGRREKLTRSFSVDNSSGCFRMSKL